MIGSTTTSVPDPRRQGLEHVAPHVGADAHQPSRPAGQAAEEAEPERLALGDLLGLVLLQHVADAIGGGGHHGAQHGQPTVRMRQIEGDDHDQNPRTAGGPTAPPIASDPARAPSASFGDGEIDPVVVEAHEAGHAFGGRRSGLVAPDDAVVDVRHPARASSTTPDP